MNTKIGNQTGNRRHPSQESVMKTTTGNTRKNNRRSVVTLLLAVITALISNSAFAQVGAPTYRDLKVANDRLTALETEIAKLTTTCGGTTSTPTCPGKVRKAKKAAVAAGCTKCVADLDGIAAKLGPLVAKDVVASLEETYGPMWRKMVSSAGASCTAQARLLAESAATTEVTEALVSALETCGEVSAKVFDPATVTALCAKGKAAFFDGEGHLIRCKADEKVIAAQGKADADLEGAKGKSAADLEHAKAEQPIAVARIEATKSVALGQLDLGKTVLYYNGGGNLNIAGGQLQLDPANAGVAFTLKLEEPKKWRPWKTAVVVIAGALVVGAVTVGLVCGLTDHCINKVEHRTASTAQALSAPPLATFAGGKVQLLPNGIAF